MNESKCCKSGTHAEMQATLPKAGGPANPNKHLHNQQVTPGSTNGMRVRTPASSAKK